MNDYDFKSQICTTREQSERLIALGLKKETADMVHYRSSSMKEWGILATPWRGDCEGCKCYYPAWSLHRLIEMTPNKVVTPTKGHYYRVQYYNRIAYKIGDYSIARFFGENLYDNIIDCIEWLIKDGYFETEYLETIHNA